jgi:hypothetical protein
VQHLSTDRSDGERDPDGDGFELHKLA